MRTMRGSLERVRQGSPTAFEEIESFRSFAYGRMSLSELGVSSWRKAIDVLRDYMTMGYAPDKYGDLIATFEEWRAIRTEAAKPTYDPFDEVWD